MQTEEGDPPGTGGGGDDGGTGGRAAGDTGTARPGNDDTLPGDGGGDEGDPPGTGGEGGIEPVQP